jgi:hypothetical protein
MTLKDTPVREQVRKIRKHIEPMVGALDSQSVKTAQIAYYKAFKPEIAKKHTVDSLNCGRNSHGDQLTIRKWFPYRD